MERAEQRRRRDQAWDAEQVRRLRRHAGLSQRELAGELNARQQTISEWERGEYAPRGTAARLLTRVAEDVQFPFEPGGSASQGDGDDGEDGEDGKDDVDDRGDLSGDGKLGAGEGADGDGSSEGDGDDD